MDGGDAAMTSDGSPAQDSPDDSSGEASMDVGMESGDAAIDAPADTGVIASQPWAFPINGFGNPNYGGIAVNANGDIAVVLPLSSATVKVLDSSGNPKWTKQVGGPPFFWEVAIDGQGAVYVGGWTNNGVDFGGGMLGQGSFLVKYDSSGNFVWSRGGYIGAEIWSVSVKSNGNVVFGGQVSSPTDFGGGMMNGGALLVELTPTNQFVRGKTFAGAGTIHPIVFDKNDNAHIQTSFEGSISFGGNTFTGPAVNSGTYSYAIAKLDPSFNHIASRDLKAAGGVHDCSLAVDANGNVAVAGAFSSTIDLGGGALTSQGNSDIFVGELTASLAPKWGKRFGDTYAQGATGTAFDPNGNVAITGAYAGTSNLNFGKGGLPQNQNSGGLFMALFDASGTTLASYGSMPNGTNQCIPVPSPSSMAFLSQPDFVVAGAYTGTCAFPSGSIFNGGGFVVRLAP
jgi:hypothetical protein